MAVKKGPALGWGEAKQPPDEYRFGTPEEIANRVHTGYDRSPENHPTHFVQISPTNTGANVNNAGKILRSGNLKFSRGPQSG